MSNYFSFSGKWGLELASWTSSWFIWFLLCIHRAKISSFWLLCILGIWIFRDYPLFTILGFSKWNAAWIGVRVGVEVFGIWDLRCWYSWLFIKFFNIARGYGFLDLSWAYRFFYLGRDFGLARWGHFIKILWNPVDLNPLSKRMQHANVIWSLAKSTKLI